MKKGRFDSSLGHSDLIAAALARRARRVVVVDMYFHPLGCPG
jgi:hypothetical protein